MEKYDKEKIKQMLLDKYREKYSASGSPMSTILKLLDCMDDAFMDEYVKDVSTFADNLDKDLQSVMEEAQATVSNLEDAIKEAKDIGVIHDERTIEALMAYKTIVNMDFDTPQQKLQNIQNASYFIWALYAKESSTASMFMKAITDVKKEDDSDNGWKKAESTYRRRY